MAEQGDARGPADRRRDRAGARRGRFLSESPSDYWDAQAASFDDEPDHGLGDPDARAAWDALLRAALPPAPAEVIDLGCGTGTLSLLAAQQGHHVSGVDISPQMIERARTKVDAAGESGRFRVGDAADPPWPAGSFDVVLARHVLWALPDPGEALDRWIALLAPDGRLVLIEGRWSTGAGLTADTVLALLGRRDRSATLVTLHDPHLWGGPIDDERYLLVSG